MQIKFGPTYINRLKWVEDFEKYIYIMWIESELNSNILVGIKVYQILKSVDYYKAVMSHFCGRLSLNTVGYV